MWQREHGRPETRQAVLGRADHDVLENGQMREKAEALERARDAEARELARLDAAQRLVAPLQPSLVGAGEPADDVEQRRLAGAIWSDDADDLVLGDGRRDIRQRREPAEADGDPLHLEQRSHARRPPSTAVASETIGGAITGKSRVVVGSGGRPRQGSNWRPTA